MDLGKYGIYLLAIAVFGLLGKQGINVIEKNSSYVATVGLSDKIVKSDFAKITISIVNETNSLKEIQNKRSSDKKSVVSFLLKCGFKENEIKTSFSNVEDMLRWSDKTEGKKKYKVTDYLTIDTPDVDLADKSLSEIAQLLNEDVFAEYSVKYLCKDIDKMRIEMLEDAAKDSRARAEKIATCSGKKILGIKNFTSGKFSIFSADAATTSDNDYSDGEGSIMKRIRVVVNASFYI